MKEVEFTSLLFIQIMTGLFERTQSIINRYYKQYDDDFPNGSRVVKEFHRRMDVIEDAFGEGVRSTIYSNTGMFLQLFRLIHRLDESGVSVTQARVRRISDLGDRIRERQGLPENVLVALASRFNRLSNQQTVSDYLFENATK
jgi:hypothetical protein